ncbi:hypothetical protein AB7M23_000001, partial [Pseudomonas sp. HLS-6 TE3448]
PEPPAMITGSNMCFCPLKSYYQKINSAYRAARPTHYNKKEN